MVSVVLSGSRCFSLVLIDYHGVILYVVIGGCQWLSVVTSSSQIVTMQWFSMIVSDSECFSMLVSCSDRFSMVHSSTQ